MTNICRVSLEDECQHDLDSPIVKSNLVDGLASRGSAYFEKACKLVPDLKSTIGLDEIILKRTLQDKAAIRQFFEKYVSKIDSIVVCGDWDQEKPMCCILRGELCETILQFVQSRRAADFMTQSVDGNVKKFERTLSGGEKLFLLSPEKNTLVLTSKGQNAIEFCDIANGRCKPASNALQKQIKSISASCQVWSYFHNANPKSDLKVEISAKSELQFRLQFGTTLGFESISEVWSSFQFEFLDEYLSTSLEGKLGLKQLRQEIHATTAFNGDSDTITFQCNVSQPQLAEFFRLLLIAQFDPNAKADSSQGSIQYLNPCTSFNLTPPANSSTAIHPRLSR